MLISAMDGSLVWSVHTHQFGTLMPSGAVHPIIPGRAEGASPETIFPGDGYGFGAPSLWLGPRNDPWSDQFNLVRVRPRVSPETPECRSRRGDRPCR